MIDDLANGQQYRVKYNWNTTGPIYKSGTGVIVKEVYNMFEGIVITTSSDKGLYTITVQTNSQECIRYGNLKTCEVTLNQKLMPRDYLGTADGYVHVEYISRTQDDSFWVVRIGAIQYYKHSPRDILSGKYSLQPPNTVNILPQSTSLLDPNFQLTPEQIKEFSGARGVPVSDYSILPGGK